MINITSFNKVYDSVQKTYNNHREGTCLSTDTKPTDWDGGSILLETDTSTVYIYDAEAEQWRAW